MNRRRFLKGAIVGATAAAAAEPRTPKGEPGRKPLLKAGHQHHCSDADLRVLAALGVQHICSDLPSRRFDDHWSVASLSRLRERVEKFGIKLDMVPLPLSSSYISRVENPHILMGKSPQRDREIDNICQMIRNAAKVGIPAVRYNLSVLGVVRTQSKQRGQFVFERSAVLAVRCLDARHAAAVVVEDGPLGHAAAGRQR